MAGWDLTKPADTDLVRNYPNLARSDKTTLQTQLQAEHDVLDSGGSATGRHKFPVGTEASLPALAGVPVGSIAYATDKRRLRVKVDSAPTAHDLPFPAGTKIVFDQDTAPVGWTRVTTNHDRMIRIVNGNTGALTGTAHTGGTASRSITGVGTVFSSQLAIGDVVEFTGVGTRVVVAIASDTAMMVDLEITISSPGVAISKVARTTGGGWDLRGLTHSHTHGFSGTTGASNDNTLNVASGTGQGPHPNHGHAFSGSTGASSVAAVSSDSTWRPKYADMIVCAKD